MPRPIDAVRVEVVGTSGRKGEIENFTSMEITQDITMPAEAAFELGNDGSWDEIQDQVGPGAEYKVMINDRPVVTGRVEANDVPLDASAGSIVRFTVRSKLSDAMYASAWPKIKVKDSTLREFILKVYEPLGYVEADFIGMDTEKDPAVARDLVTGKRSRNKGEPRQVAVSRIKVSEARVKPPESVYAAADRHLRRFGFMHWDVGDGRIVISAPNDTQDPQYFFNMKRLDSGNNNILKATRVQDFSGIPSALGVYGVGGRRNFSKARVGHIELDDDVIAAGFYRPVIIIAEGIKRQDIAERSAARELSARQKMKDNWNIEVDGFSYWDSQTATNYATDTVAQIETDVAGGNLGAYYIHRVTMRRGPDQGDVTSLTMLRRGIWKL